MLSHELRTKYLLFFESKGHIIVPSDSLVPDDASLLYTSAGMVQFKPYFVGSRVPPGPRVVTCQKCMRTDDIDEVGDAVHHTFFEMLGNFSFGEYFKRESIVWAWEFLTEVLKLDPNTLWTSVYLDDDEAADVWMKDIGFPASKIVRLGEDKNYWPADAPSKGPNGPCGPCNEIFVDVTPQLGPPEDPAWSIAHDSNRFVEIWNLVFQQFDRKEDGTLEPLPTKNIDTGMGLERTVAVLQGTPTDYETDLFRPIISRVESLSGARYGTADDTDAAIRVVADHARAAAFVIADGVMPSNVGRGYVLRRLIRNSIVKGRKLGLDRPFLTELLPTVIEIMGSAYQDIVERRTYIEKVIDSEENKFRSTLQSGLQRLEDHIAAASSSEQKTLAGADAFTLYDTYGFPLELTRDIAAESGVTVDIEGFRSSMDEQRKRAKDASDFGAVMTAGGDSILAEIEKTLQPTGFTGYDQTTGEARILAILKGGETASTAEEGDEVDLVLDVTPFYGEAGGQVGDAGVMTSDAARIEVSDTVRASHFFFHRSRVTAGSLGLGDVVHCEVDVERRQAIARAHTATHLLHAALRAELGEHALQKGSIVEPDRLRFDFSHFQAVSPDELRSIETRVNRMILQDVESDTVVTTIDEARKLGAVALFGEKYGSEVRVVRMGDLSVELCGGTHLCHTSQVGLFRITAESSIGAGLRRVEAVTGQAAVLRVFEAEDQLHGAAEALGVSPAEVVSAAERASHALREAQREIDKLKSRGAADAAADLAGSAQQAGDIKYVAASVSTVDLPTLQKLVDGVAEKLREGVVVLAGVENGRILFVGKVTPSLVQKGFHAGNMLREVAKVAGGGGGGKPEFAQAGGKDASKVDDALAKAGEIIKTQAEAT